MSDPEVLAVLRQWLRYAGEDLRASEVLLEGDGVPRVSCFHAQQAAEKSIKAIFVFSSGACNPARPLPPSATP